MAEMARLACVVADAAGRGGLRLVGGPGGGLIPRAAADAVCVAGASSKVGSCGTTSCMTRPPPTEGRLCSLAANGGDGDCARL
eukprot:CAMPEP_0175915730 /NCGR_PEP_ID=MMETSP0108-20121206/10470_1 /TAXON_ID=195067 ORGANISM="Goniomonas pacifica, Strain CCMP1869" /NCGR_SAMPLE_ID=MMETSP0108 /ASSEMBLY_ACC=CAM_ASM_000204 /LENGTH=82 /DNA_ID=CAMNT_0017238237 /DNA_START=395 /DNA_END=643 /DNA_ORIENTATION=-